MAAMYVDDNGTNTAPYDTWVKAANLVATALAAQAAGEIIYISSDTVETYTGDTTLASANGVSANPITIISADKTSGEPPTVYENMVAGGGSLDAKSDAAWDLLLAGWDIWIGIHGIVGDNLTLGANEVSTQVHDSKLEVDDNTTIGVTAEEAITLENVDLEQVTAGLISVNANLDWRGGSFKFNGGSINTNLFSLSDSTGSNLRIEDVDFQDLDAGDYLVSDSYATHNILLKRCKIPAAVNYMNNGPTGASCIVNFHSVDDGDNIHSFKEYRFQGHTEDDTGIFLDATYDGANEYSAEMVSNANAIEFTRPLKFKLCEIYIGATGKVIKVELITTDGAAAVDLFDDDFWIEVEYPDSGTAALGNVLSTRMTDILDTPAPLAASAKGAGDWTGELADTNYYKVDMDFTGVADEATGVYTIWACLARPSTVVYVDPKVTVT